MGQIVAQGSKEETMQHLMHFVGIYNISEKETQQIAKNHFDKLLREVTKKDFQYSD